MVRVDDGKPLPKRSDLGDDDQSAWETDVHGKPRDPWQFVNYLPMMNDDGKLFTFTTSSRGGINTIARLAKRYATPPQASSGRLPDHLARRRLVPASRTKSLVGSSSPSSCRPDMSPKQSSSPHWRRPVLPHQKTDRHRRFNPNSMTSFQTRFLSKQQPEPGFWPGSFKKSLSYAKRSRSGLASRGSRCALFSMLRRQ